MLNLNKWDFITKLESILDSKNIEEIKSPYTNIFINEFKNKSVNEYIKQNENFNHEEFKKIIELYDIEYFKIYLESMKKYIYFNCKEYLNSSLSIFFNFKDIDYKNSNVSLFIDNLINYKILIEETLFYINSFNYYFKKDNNNFKTYIDKVFKLDLKKSYYSILLLSFTYFEKHLWEGVNIAIINYYFLFYIIIINFIFGKYNIGNFQLMKLAFEFIIGLLFKIFAKKITLNINKRLKYAQLSSIMQDYNKIFPNFLLLIQENRDFVKSKYLNCCFNFMVNKSIFFSNFNEMQLFIEKLKISNINKNIKKEILEESNKIDNFLKDLNINIENQEEFIIIN